jgi:uncharacterized protein YdiU (UPF0061 family)
MGRYAYRNQPGIGQWNLARLAECLLPLLEPDEEKAVEVANAVLKTFGERFQSAWLAIFRQKIGLASETQGNGGGDAELLQELLSVIQAGEADFTLAFRRLADCAEGRTAAFLSLFADPVAAAGWLAKWRERLAAEQGSQEERAAAMRLVNPAIIPRNHRIEEAIAAALVGDLSLFERLLQALEKPFEERPEFAVYADPPKTDQRVTQTFCGT